MGSVSLCVEMKYMKVTIKNTIKTYRTLQASWNWFTALGISPHTMLRLPCAKMATADSAASILN